MSAIVIPDDAPPVMGSSAAYQGFRDRHEITYYDTLPGSEERLAERCHSAEIVINIRSSSRFSDAVFAACPHLKLLSLWGTGTDNVDLAAARSRGIVVCNTPGVSAPSIAEHTLALALAVARRVPALDAQVRQGQWPRGGMVQLAGKTLGVIGMGAIGSRVAALGTGIGMRVLCWTMNARETGFAMVPLETLLRESDVVSLHLRLSDQTRGFIGASQLAAMRQGALLINTARGAIVDEAAMIESLRSGHLRGAGLDVFDVEPLPAGHPLTKLDNVVLSPHCAGITPEALEAGLALALTNVENFLAGSPTHVVA